MLVKINGNRIVSTISTSSKQQEELILQEDSTYIQIEYSLLEPLYLYEYKNGSISLIADWEAIKATREEELRTAMIPTSPTFEELQSQKFIELNIYADNQVKIMSAKYSTLETDSFLDKRTEALAYRVDSSSATPYINSLAKGDETTRIALINAILAKVDALAGLEAFVSVTREKIELSSTLEELEDIVI